MINFVKLVKSKKMKKKIAILTIATAICLVITCWLGIKSNNNQYSGLLLENIEALASRESNPSPCVYRITYRCMYYVPLSDWNGLLKFEIDATTRD